MKITRKQMETEIKQKFPRIYYIARKFRFADKKVVEFYYNKFVLRQGGN